MDIHLDNPTINPVTGSWVDQVHLKRNALQVPWLEQVKFQPAMFFD